MPASRSRLAVIFLTVFIDIVGFGIVIPILPYYAEHFGAKGLEFGALLGVYSLMQFFANTLLGRWSDRVGRRPILLATMLLNAAGYVRSRARIGRCSSHASSGGSPAATSVPHRPTSRTLPRR